LLASILASDGGLLLHGSGLLIDGAAAAIIGPSGAGKTTAAHLIRADRLLSDDAIAVTDVDAQSRLHATPLGRESDGPGSAPLRAVFFPCKETGFAVRRISARDALVRSAQEQTDTFACVFAPMRGLAIRNLARLFRKVPAYELGFSLDGIDREAIRRVLSES
jgi:ABC-type cobalamin/Fe3+-siderophores transport system ATPase subunit